VAGYADVTDVQARVPTQLLEIDASSQPSQSMVETWLEADSRWVDSTLRWKYAVPVTDPADQVILREIVADLTAARCWDVVGGHSAENPAGGAALATRAAQRLAYNRNTGQAMLVLPSAALSDSGEAEVGQPEGSFTDPDSDEEGVNDRFFRISQEF
jgi:hypothetical protein